MAQGDEEGLLKRWSRRKLEEREKRRQAVSPPGQAGEPAQAAPAAPAEDEPVVAAAAPLDLPPIDSLTKESDFTVFMREGVPEELRRQALRKLWRTDPVFDNLDGLLEYGEDYSQQFKAGAVISTVYRVGKGMVQAVEEIADAPPPSEDAEGAAETDRDSEQAVARAEPAPEPEKDS